MDPRLREVTERIRERSRPTRADYLERMQTARAAGSARTRLSCTNLAHGFAASATSDKEALRAGGWPNIGIVSAYNDMLSAHQPFERYPALIKRAAREAGAVAQFAGGVPAMCDGVTQGQAGMELSLFSRDVIAMATGIALAHNMFDAALCLGICDKIVPGLLMGALSFGHLPVVFVPGGPMPSGMPNKEKARIRRLHAEGQVGRDELLQSEAASYHAPGTCTFYGTANSNQLLMEVMGLHMPGAAFVPPNTPLRDALTMAATRRAAGITALGGDYRPLANVVDERAIVNAIVGLLATGGSTNHTLHLVAIARCAGILLNWDDFGDLSAFVPLLARIYPNGDADVNRFHEAGGSGFLIRELLDAGLLHEDVQTVMGAGLRTHVMQPQLVDERLEWQAPPAASGDLDVLRPAANPFSTHGGIAVLRGNLGRAVIKTAAVADAHQLVEAPAVVFDRQEDVIAAFQAGQLERNFVAVVRFQGPRANGMPELHQLTPALTSLQRRGFRVALVTDGRMSGASGSVPAAIHVTPECASQGPLARVRDGDPIRVDCRGGRLEILVAEREWALRAPVVLEHLRNETGMGREMFRTLRRAVGDAEAGAMSLM
ncbi:MAG TPA: phosphogluconate dehydratase [Steroidobacteraceae bacterium]|nr:phosphogluconate dehydratase [Steroidobacteraceae bacterium]